MDPTLAGWAALVAGTVLILLVDLSALHRGTQDISMRRPGRV